MKFPECRVQVVIPCEYRVVLVCVCVMSVRGSERGRCVVQVWEESGSSTRT